MKRTSALKAIAVSLFALLMVVTVSNAGTAFGNGALTTSSPTFVNPGGSTVGTKRHYYNVVSVTVDTTGAYTFEVSSFNTRQGQQNSDALDTNLRIYVDAFDPLSPSVNTIGFNDDFSGTLTVLPGPFAGVGLSTNATGFQGAQPSSRLPSVNMNVGSTFFLVIASFRSTDFNGAGTEAGQPTGNYWYGISGPGSISATAIGPAEVAMRVFKTNSNVVVAWPSTATGWSLHSNTNIATASWQDVTNTINVVGEENQVTIAPTSGNRFFRLSKP